MSKSIFTILSAIGEGGFATVYKCKLSDTNTEYAVKVLHSNSSEEDRKRFINEIEYLKILKDHQGIVKLIRECEPNDQQPWYIMELADENLKEYIIKNFSRLKKGDLYEIILDILDAVKFAHDREILHRDISYSNILVFNTATVKKIKVADFGLGKDLNTQSELTRSDERELGQAYFISPEQKVKLKSATIQSDIYSLGKLILFILTQNIFGNHTELESAERYLVGKATQFDPSLRFRSVQEMIDYLEILSRQLTNQCALWDKSLKNVLSTNLISVTDDDFFNFLLQNHSLVNFLDDFLIPFCNLVLNTSYLNTIPSFGRNKIFILISHVDKMFENFSREHNFDFRQIDLITDCYIKILNYTDDSQTKLILLKRLWRFAFFYNRYYTQDLIKLNLNSKNITSEIENDFAFFIEANMNYSGVPVVLNGIRLPPTIENIINKFKALV
ncbi:MAG: serine/threonine protein kinase [Ignavibacteriaceae bacterium]|nr:serine/threonine protein kinase [Ignavibacteriaceae bacterium]